MSLELIAKRLKDARRQSDLERAQSDLYWLATEILGYAWSPEKQQGITESFHKPMCARMDRLRQHPRVLTLSHRGSLKSTVFTIALAIQEVLRDPDITILIPHAVEEEAQKLVAECIEHFKSNNKLRHLRPEIMPHPKSKTWWGAGRMTVRRQRFSRQPTIMGVGAGSEIVGAHVDMILADDIIGRRTIENSELPKIHSWWQNTALPVLNPAGRIRGVGTRWHPDDIWGTFINTGSWDCLVRSCSEIDGVPDYTLQNPVHYGPEPDGRKKAIKRLERAQDEMKGDFPGQMMNDPSPASEKPWDREACEHYVDAKYVAGAGTVYLVHDPAPAKTGSLDATGAKLRADGSKDFWAIALFKLRRNGDRCEIIWIDGDQSREWTVDEGLRRGCELQRKWGCRRVAIEMVGQAGNIYESRLRVIAREEGVKYTPIKLTSTMKGKNLRFGNLCSRAKADEFLIAQTVPEKIRNVFLMQAREWRPLETGRNSLKYDDMADVVSYCTDSAFDHYEMTEQMQEWSPYRTPPDEGPMSGGRYVRW